MENLFVLCLAIFLPLPFLHLLVDARIFNAICFSIFFITTTTTTIVFGDLWWLCIVGFCLYFTNINPISRPLCVCVGVRWLDCWFGLVWFGLFTGSLVHWLRVLQPKPNTLCVCVF